MKDSCGYFISFEGLDGCGKTTQSKLLQQYLQDISISVLWTREPGGTKIGNEIRDLLAAYTPDIDSYTIFLLLMASRRQHIKEFISPNLKSGNWVICDRFIDSTLAYQNALDNISFDFTLKAHKDFSIEYWPNLTFYLDVPIVELESRLRSNNNVDYYDNLSLLQKECLRNNFLELAKLYPERIIIINGYGSQDEIHSFIVSKVKQRFFCR